MSKRLQIALTVLGALLYAAAARANPVEFKADPESARRGVGSYLVERSANTLTISVLDPKGAEIQQISAILGLQGATRMQVKAGDEDLTVALDFAARHFSVTDNTTGESATATLRHGQPLLVEGSTEFLQEHSEAVSLAAIAYEQSLINLGLRATAPTTPPAIAPQCSPHSHQLLPHSASPSAGAGNSSVPKLLGGDGGGGCSGVFVVGTGVGSTLAIACANAEQEANNQCSNAYCLGCCQLLEVPNTKSPCGCDCLFSNGSICDCNATGQACADDGSDNGGSSGGGPGGGSLCRTESGSCDASCASCSKV